MDKNHLSGQDIFQYCDKELPPEDMPETLKHLENCEDCKQEVEKFQSFSEGLYESVKNSLSIERTHECLRDMNIAAYLENNISSDERTTIEEHMCKCGYCLTIIAESKKNLVEEIKKEGSQIPYEKIMLVVRQQLRYRSLLEKFAMLLKKGTPIVRNALEGIKNDIEITLKDTFTYSSPQFVPAFGEYKANVLSPFGTIRYPIIFEWLPYEKAGQYVISIEGSDWSCKTSDTHIEITEKDLKLDCEKEYMWKLKVMKVKEVIDEITGFFSLISLKDLEEVKEIEHHINDIEPIEDRLLLFGEILERKKLFIEAIQKYKQSYALQSFPGLAYRIAFCYLNLAR